MGDVMAGIVSLVGAHHQFSDSPRDRRRPTLSSKLNWTPFPPIIAYGTQGRSVVVSNRPVSL